MVLNVSVVESVAHLSATLFQLIACNPERFSSDRVLFLIFCFPFQSLRRLGLSICSSRLFCCFPSLDSSASDAGSSHNNLARHLKKSYQDDNEVMDVFNKISELFPGVNRSGSPFGRTFKVNYNYNLY